MCHRPAVGQQSPSSQPQSMMLTLTLVLEPVAVVEVAGVPPEHEPPLCSCLFDTSTIHCQQAWPPVTFVDELKCLHLDDVTHPDCQHCGVV